MTDEKQTLKDRVNELEASMADLRDEFSGKMLKLEAELKTVRYLAQENSQEDPQEDRYAWEQTTGSSKEEEPTQAVSQTHFQEPQAVIPAEPEIPEAPQVTTNNDEDVWHGYELDYTSKKEKKKNREPGVLSLFVSSFLQAILTFIINSLTVIKAPVHELYSRLIKLYLHYQRQGKAPVFLMTVAGLITLTFGFGYLLQYSFSTLFNDALKAATGFVIGVGIIAAGILLSKKKTDFRDYAASVIALGVRASSLILMHLAGCKSLSGKA